jgi:hypothetical protein
MKAQLRQIETSHQEVQLPIRFADVVEQVSKLTATPIEAALVIDRMLRRGNIRFAEHVDVSQLTLTR